jgi:hypothetical protein
LQDLLHCSIANFFYFEVNYLNIIKLILFLKYYPLRQYKFLNINCECNLALMKPT